MDHEAIPKARRILDQVRSRDGFHLGQHLTHSPPIHGSGERCEKVSCRGQGEEFW